MAREAAFLRDLGWAVGGGRTRAAPMSQRGGGGTWATPVSQRGGGCALEGGGGRPHGAPTGPTWGPSVCAPPLRHRTDSSPQSDVRRLSPHSMPREKRVQGGWPA